MLLLLFGCIALFVAVIVFMMWYSNFVFRKMYGNIRYSIDHIEMSGAPPEVWQKKLMRTMNRCSNDDQKSKAFKKYTDFVDKKIKNYVSFMERTTTVANEASRAATIAALKDFRRDYIDDLHMTLNIP